MKLTFFNKEGVEFSTRQLITLEEDKIGASVDGYNGTLASLKPNEKGYGLSYYWHLPLYLMSTREKIAGEKRAPRTWHYVKLT